MRNPSQPRALLEQQKSDSSVAVLTFQVPHPRRFCEGGFFAAQINSETTNRRLLAACFSLPNLPILIGTQEKTETAVNHCKHKTATHSDRYRFAVFFSRFLARESAPDLAQLPIHGIASAIQTTANILTGRRQRVHGISLRSSRHLGFATGGLP